jgi:hypothetical protein
MDAYSYYVEDALMSNCTCISPCCSHVWPPLQPHFGLISFYCVGAVPLEVKYREHLAYSEQLMSFWLNQTNLKHIPLEYQGERLR